MDEIEADVILVALRIYTSIRAAARGLDISIDKLKGRINKYGLKGHVKE